MKTKNIIALIIFIIIGINTARCQENISSKEMIQKIDSVATSNNIIKGVVNILFITNTFDNTHTRTKSITNVKNFSFDGQFLVIENKYFNINKLLYFEVLNDRIEFYFQGY